MSIEYLVTDCYWAAPGYLDYATANITQNGTSLEFDMGYGELGTGTVCGDTVQYSFSEEVPEYEYSYLQQGILTLTSPGFMEGTASFSEAWHSGSCDADVRIEASLIYPLATDDENNTAVVINERRDRGVLVVMRPRGQGTGGLVPIGYVEPGGSVVFPLPPGNWDVFTTYSDKGEAQFDYLGMMPDKMTSGPSEGIDLRGSDLDSRLLHD
jgi:hypothetical protein